MNKKPILSAALFVLISVSVFSGIANAYWIWTPETKKFTNPKNAVKDSPKEQFDFGMSYYEAKDFQRAAAEFDKLAKQYEFSEHASKAQYYVGLCYENMNKYYLAYQNYQKAIDNFPHIANTEEILAREYAIGNLYLSKPGPKVLGTDIMAPLDRAVEIFKKVVENAPYGKFAEEAQFKLGEALKKSERYEEAVQAFHKLVEDYPKSKLVTQAMYEESHCAYKASLRPAYDASATDNAIKTFEKFVNKNKDADLAKNADNTMKRLKDNVSEKTFRAAEFYESQGKIQAAIIYYQDMIDTYPESSFVEKARARIEALKARGTKKPAPPIDLSKKKSEQVAREKKPWTPFKFMSGKPKEATEATEATEVTEAPAETTPETPKKKSWNPFNFDMGKKKPKAPAAQAETAPAKEIQPKKSPWNIFNLGSKKEAVAKDAAEEEAPAKKSPWNLFNIGVKKETAEKDAEKKKGWKPFRFDTMKMVEPKKAAEAPVVVEAPAAQVKEGPVPAIETPVPETQAIEPEAAEPKIEEPQVVPPAVEEPKAVELQAVEPQTVEPQAVAPQAAEPQVVEPVTTPSAAEPQIIAPPAVTPQAAEPQAVEEPKITETINTEGTAPAIVPPAPKKKGWKPFNFDTKKGLKETPEKKGWKPLNFGTNDNTMAVTDRRW